MLVVGDSDMREIQALIRWDPHGYADRELAERAALHLPPAVRIAQLTGPALAALEVADELESELGTPDRAPLRSVARPGGVRHLVARDLDCRWGRADRCPAPDPVRSQRTSGRHGGSPDRPGVPALIRL